MIVSIIQYKGVEAIVESGLLGAVDHLKQYTSSFSMDPTCIQLIYGFRVLKVRPLQFCRQPSPSSKSTLV